MPREYIPVFIFAALAAAFPAVTIILMKYIRPTSTSVGAKLKPYECGIPPESDARGRYSTRFYIIAMLFVIFDVETIFLFPWAVSYAHARVFEGTNYPLYFMASMFVFLGILVVGYIWLYRKGALDWV
ncbi:MAG TPA: NADH-quinone oxidoreductase subunit A [Candidatus Acidoferrales bacterium]|jgi:NADH-quinone oxidoreductase subunit A|nr:NADH-quinone oxidoreductase subunit A [Candidatus Acidoferrales bacterium]